MPPNHTHETHKPIRNHPAAAAPVTRGVPQSYALEIDEELDDSSPPRRKALPIPTRYVVRGRGKPLVYYAIQSLEPQWEL